jgi:hypothetical protein
MGVNDASSILCSRKYNNFTLDSSLPPQILWPLHMSNMLNGMTCQYQTLTVQRMVSLHDQIQQSHVTQGSRTVLTGCAKFMLLCQPADRLCGLVVRVSGYRFRGPGFDSRSFQIFWEGAGRKRDPLSLVRTNEELLGRKRSRSGQENRD